MQTRLGLLISVCVKPLMFTMSQAYTYAYIPRKQTESLTANQSLDCRITRHQHTPLSEPVERTSKRFLYEGRRVRWQFKSFPWHSTKWAYLLPHNCTGKSNCISDAQCFHWKKTPPTTKKNNRGEMHCIDSMFAGWSSFIGTMLQDSDIIFTTK